MNIKQAALKAAQGIDTEDFMHHIAWDEVILPKLLETREILTRQLVESVLNPGAQNGETREQLAGKIQGIDFVMKLFTNLVKDGREARGNLQSVNVSLA